MSDIRPLPSSLCTNVHRRLCPTCQAIFTIKIIQDEPTIHHTDGAAFRAAVEQGCYFCTWSFRAYQRNEQHPISHTTYLGPGPVMEYENACYVCIYVHVAVTEHPVLTVFRGWKTESDRPIPNYVRGTLESSVRAPQSLQVAKRWLQDCISRHPECQESKPHTTLPSRLVHVWQNALDLKIEGKICRGETLRAGTLYLSLSHCWGKARFLTTTRRNVREFESSLPVENLSRTFQDALLATISLGFEYIWIDSLCIVQDDKDEWSRESKLMGEVYKNATCNISASGFADGEDGFMLRQRQVDPTPFIVNIDPQKMESTWPEICHPGSYWLTHDPPWSDVTEGPLFQRAWVLQEQLLASRALHFGEDQMFWECKRTFANEVWPQGWTDTIYGQNFSLFLEQDDVWQVTVADAFANDRSLFNAWYHIVRNYSERQLSVASDHLPALAGIASKFEARLRSSYWYGLWGKDIHRGLLFRQVAFYTIRGSILPPLWEDTPSWSWSAMHKTVYWRGDPGNSDTEVVKICKIKMPTAIDGRVLQLNGRLVPLLSSGYRKLNLAFGRSSILGTNATGFELTVYPDEWFFSSFQTAGSNVHCRDFFDNMTTAFCKATVFVPMLCESSPQHGYYMMHGLMLYAPNGLARGMYRRVGAAELHLDRHVNMDYDTVIAELRAYQEPLQNEWYHETDGAGNYVFSIV